MDAIEWCRSHGVTELNGLKLTPGGNVSWEPGMSDMELPDMWEAADLIGGAGDVSGEPRSGNA